MAVLDIGGGCAVSDTTIQVDKLRFRSRHPQPGARAATITPGVSTVNNWPANWFIDDDGSVNLTFSAGNDSLQSTMALYPMTATDTTGLDYLGISDADPRNQPYRSADYQIIGNPITCLPKTKLRCS